MDLKQLTLPIIASPMFLASGPELVKACCQSGIIGAFPSLNARSSDILEEWIIDIKNTLGTGALFAINLVVHKSNGRLEQDLAVIARQQVPIVITSLGASVDVIETIHNYGGKVFHDVVNTRFARKAADAGVDGLIAVCNGAGGHAGDMNPFALVGEIRQFFSGTIILAGAISSGQDILAAQAMGADLVYMGTRFLSASEARNADDYKAMLVDSQAADIIYTPQISGVPASFLKPSLAQHDIDLTTLTPPTKLDFGSELEAENDAPSQHEGLNGAKPWKDLWSAGQGVGQIDRIQPTASLIQQLQREYQDAQKRLIGSTQQVRNPLFENA